MKQVPSMRLSLLRQVKMLRFFLSFAKHLSKVLNGRSTYSNGRAVMATGK